MINIQPEVWENNPTPFYYYDLDLLRRTVETAKREADKYGYRLHYATKANANPAVMSLISSSGLGADCVSGGEIEAALKAGFSADKIVFAGVGKADWEINLGLDSDIFCFNVESLPELEVINTLAAKKGKTARVALRLNPDIDAHTHRHITTGTRENKFGINLDKIDETLDMLKSCNNLRFTGLHCHIGSQITDFEPLQRLCKATVSLSEYFRQRGFEPENINFGGGLGIDYDAPDQFPIPDFKSYFEVFHRNYPSTAGQTVHFEPGRSIVGQCGALISKVLYVKEGSDKKFVILDAGFTDLIRPAFYGAHHKIENLTSKHAEQEIYDVVGPICESSDCFARDVALPLTVRGDYVALRSAGAYGEIMASQYNLRKIPAAVNSEQ